jgi:hypothetical protein
MNKSVHDWNQYAHVGWTGRDNIIIEHGEWGMTALAGVMNEWGRISFLFFFYLPLQVRTLQCTYGLY